MNDSGEGRGRSPQTPQTPQDQDSAAPPERAGSCPVTWLEAVLRAAGAARVGGKWQCPAHATVGEHSPSLSVSAGREGQLLIKCHAGCTWRKVLRSLFVTSDALWVAPPTPPERHAQFLLRHLTFPPPKLAGGTGAGGRSPLRGFRRDALHPYAARGADSRTVAVKVRYRHPETGEKTVRWKSRGPDGAPCSGLNGLREADLALYYEHEIRLDRRVVVCESESSVDALREAGVCATTWPGGASSPPLDYLAAVLGRHPDVLIVPDHDDAGLACRDRLTATLPHAQVLLGEPGEDARDLLHRLGPVVFESAGHDERKIEDIIENTAPTATGGEVRSADHFDPVELAVAALGDEHGHAVDPEAFADPDVAALLAEIVAHPDQLAGTVRALRVLLGSVHARNATAPAEAATAPEMCDLCHRRVRGEPLYATVEPASGSDVVVARVVGWVPAAGPARKSPGSTRCWLRSVAAAEEPTPGPPRTETYGSPRAGRRPVLIASSATSTTGGSTA